MQQGYEMLDYSPEVPKKSTKYIIIAIALLLIASTTSNTPPRQETTETTSGVNSFNVQNNQQTQALSTEVSNSTTNVAPTTQTIHFGVDSAILLHGEDAKVEYFLTKVKDGKGKVSIDGYTDNLGSYAHGILISEQRAKTIESLLKQLGLGKQLSLAIKGNAEGDPIGDNSTADGRALNRRVELKFVPSN